jgi:hypothetical protein
MMGSFALLCCCFNKNHQVERQLKKHEGSVAAIFVGGASYPWSWDIVEPTAQFARGLRRLATEHGAFLEGDLPCLLLYHPSTRSLAVRCGSSNSTPSHRFAISPSESTTFSRNSDEDDME